MKYFNMKKLKPSALIYVIFRVSSPTLNIYRMLDHAVIIVVQTVIQTMDHSQQLCYVCFHRPLVSMSERSQAYALSSSTFANVWRNQKPVSRTMTAGFIGSRMRWSCWRQMIRPQRLVNIYLCWNIPLNLLYFCEWKQPLWTSCTNSNNSIWRWGR